MALSTIEWTDYTFNPWSGCTKVSPGCANCYAEVNYSVKMRGVKWGPSGNRIVKAESGWKGPLKWDRDAKAAGERRRVFCASLADVFENWKGRICDARGLAGFKFNIDGTWGFGPDGSGDPWNDKIGNATALTMSDVRARLFRLIDDTPNLDWLLLTKRPENIHWMWPHFQKNVWLGASVENQEMAEQRIKYLTGVPAEVRFLSVEPLLGPIDLTNLLADLHWVIVGGESGPGARPCNVNWVRDIVDQCRTADVPCFVKQLGSVPQWSEADIWAGATDKRYDKKGGDMSEWPTDLQVREFPR